MEWEVIPTWWVNAWFIHPSSEVSATTLSTLVCILMFDCAVQYCKLQRYTILVTFPCKILEIYLVRYMIDCEFVMIRGSFGGPFRCNQSRGDIKRLKNPYDVSPSMQYSEALEDFSTSSIIDSRAKILVMYIIFSLVFIDSFHLVLIFIAWHLPLFGLLSILSCSWITHSHFFFLSFIFLKDFFFFLALIFA